MTYFGLFGAPGLCKNLVIEGARKQHRFSLHAGLTGRRLKVQAEQTMGSAALSTPSLGLRRFC